MAERIPFVDRPGISVDIVQRVRAACQGHSEKAWELLEALVNTDSYPEDLPGLESIVELIAPRWSDLGFTTDVHRTEAGLPVLFARRGDPRAPTVLILLHLDTVFPPGTAAERPFRVQDEKAYGPGVADMKGGVVAAWTAVQGALEVTDGLDQLNLVILNTTDEEAGSVQSRPLIEEQCPQADLALVFEPGRPDGSMVTTRRGVRRYRIHVRGKPAHTGVEPWNGINAIEEMAHKILAIQKLNDRDTFLSVTVALAGGGSRINIVPEDASIDVDVRIPDLQIAEATHESIEQIVGQDHIAGVSSRYEIFADRPPMVPHGPVSSLGRRLQEMARMIDVELPVAATGGGSDGCFTSALGVPTLDGLGPVGGGYHTPDEFLLAETLEERSTIAGSLLVNLNG